MLVTVKYIRNGLNTAKDLKNTKHSHLIKRCQKPKTSYSQRNGTRCRKPKRPLAAKRSKPVRGCLAAKRCRKPKRSLAAKRFECKTPFEVDIAFAVFIPLRVCVLTFWSLYYTLLSLYSLLAPLAAHIFAYMYMHPFMGFQRTCTYIPLWDF